MNFGHINRVAKIFLIIFSRFYFVLSVICCTFALWKIII
nr:MAG TPA: hypothetical protein [Caudoviricetes sp.]DAZ15459.1 MAG TPA: hypothetical protein [Caudoviricetes sp.]